MVYFIVSVAPIMDQAQYQANCLLQIQQSVSQLGGDPQSPILAETAELIIRSMTGPWRSFHTPQHIFDVGHGGGPVEVLAALFHDMVYVQVDLGIHVNLSRFLSPYVREVGQALVIDPEPNRIDDIFEMLMTMFGFETGHKLSPFAGQNEFLSALVAVRCLVAVLPKAALVQIAACIEATIPFRGLTPEGKSCSQQLHDRLMLISDRLNLGFDTDFCTRVVEMCVRVSNRDIDNFASIDPSEFLNNTWNLIPETNHELLNANTYTVAGYRISLQKMEGFLSFLKPEVVFRQFGQEPESQVHQQRLELTQRNLEVARMYLRIKLLSIGLLEALSMRIGHGVSLTSLMGEKPHAGETPVLLQDHLPVVSEPYQPRNDIERYVMDLLETGRTAETVHDTRHSPVGSYLVRLKGVDECLRMLEQVRPFFADVSKAGDILKMMDQIVVDTLVQAIVRVMRSRTDALISSAAVAH
jgi:hypothetical protein